MFLPNEPALRRYLARQKLPGGLDAEDDADEHSDRAGKRAREGKALLKLIPAWIAEAHQHHVRRRRFQTRHETRPLRKNRDIGKTSLAQSLSDPRGPLHLT